MTLLKFVQEGKVKSSNFQIDLSTVVRFSIGQDQTFTTDVFQMVR